MSNFATSLMRSIAQVIVGFVVTWFAARGLDIPENVENWLLGALVAGGILLWTALVRWLETRQGNGQFPVLARRLAGILMLGTGVNQPAYVPMATQIEAVNDEMGTRVTNVS